MTLNARLNLFFLATLALVLVAFSTTLYVLAASHLDREADNRQESVLNTLVAAADVDNEGVEWNPQKRQLRLHEEIGNADIRWIVVDSNGHPLDRSSNVRDGDVLTEYLRTAAIGGQTTEKLVEMSELWRVVQQRLPSTATIADSPTSQQTDHTEDENKFPAIGIAVGISLEPVERSLHELLVVLCSLCAGFWVLAAFFGKWVCRRALAPVNRLAKAAREMRAADRGGHLPNSGTHDELEGLARAFNGLLDRTYESFERQQRFTGDASHQLRTPLTAMLGQIEVALRKDRTNEEYQRTLSSIQEQARRLSQIVEMLLFLARADAEAAIPGMEIINLSDWLAGHLRLRSGDPRAADVHVENTSATPVFVKVDSVLLGQLLDNLLDNAFKYSQAGSMILLRLSNGPNDACVEIRDSGCGIPPADLPRVFEPFYRSFSAVRAGAGGIGLGLSVAQRITKIFAGRLTVQSELGKGSSFFVRLPLVPPIPPSEKSTAGTIVPSLKMQS